MEKLIIALLGAALGIAIGAWLIEWSWNGVIVDVFHLPALSWFQSFQLSVLGHSVTGSVYHHKSEK